MCIYIIIYIYIYIYIEREKEIHRYIDTYTHTHTLYNMSGSQRPPPRKGGRRGPELRPINTYLQFE